MSTLYSSSGYSSKKDFLESLEGCVSVRISILSGGVVYYEAIIVLRVSHTLERFIVSSYGDFNFFSVKRV